MRQPQPRPLSHDRGRPSFQTSTVTHFNKFAKKKVDKKYLELGQNVMCIHNKEMATVKFVGHTDFATGIWVGLEMKKPIGRYFPYYSKYFSESNVNVNNIFHR